jgi:hypothetical protein
MDKSEIKQGSFIKQTQYCLPVEIDLSVVPARLGIWFFRLSHRTTVIQDLLFRRQFSLVLDNRTHVNVEACIFLFSTTTNLTTYPSSWLGLGLFLLCHCKRGFRLVPVVVSKLINFAICICCFLSFVASHILSINCVR